MIKILIKKASYVVLMLFIISIISFGAIHLAPNSFFSAGELNPNITEDTIKHLKLIYGLDKPLWQQYLSWIGALIQLDFGVSFASGKSVIQEIKDRIWITLGINLASMIIIFSIALYFGIKSALREGKLFDRIIKQLSLISFSMPSFYLSLILIIVFSIYLGIMPIGGLYSLEPKNGILKFFDLIWHLVLPIFVIVFISFGSLCMYVRSLTLEILKSDYIFFAKARNISQKEIVKKYILPNLSPPLITILGLSVPGLIGGSVILESIFSINGMGLLFYQSALSRDYPLIMGILIITAFLTLIGNILADLILLKINPFFKEL
jgi:peptide/nickel transport system permease protein